MALFGFSKDKKGGGNSDLVLAYLEDAQRVRSPFFLQDARKVDLPATLQAIDEEAGTFSVGLGMPFNGDKGAKVEFTLYHEGLRIMGATRVAELRGGSVVLELPADLELKERRKHPRARLNPKEGANLTGLSSLFEGIGINGTLENVSEGGCRVRVDKALNIKDERRLPLGVALVPPGHAFMLLKLNKVPRCPAVMELSGKVAYAEDSGGLCLGIVFEQPRADVAAALRSLVSSRAGAVPTSLPPKARRKPVAEEDEDLLPRREARKPDPEPAPKPVPKPDPPPVPVVPPEVAAPVPAPEASPAPAASRNSPLLRLKKRTRSIVLLAPGANGSLLREHLEEEGYGKVVLATDWAETIEQLHEGGAGLLLVDLERPILEVLEMLGKLTEAELALPPTVLAADEVSKAIVIAASRVGVTQLLVRPYALDEAFSTMVEEQMGLA